MDCLYVDGVHVLLFCVCSNCLSVCFYMYVAYNLYCAAIMANKDMCGGNMRTYGTELLETNYPISFNSGPDTWIVPFYWQPDGRGNET